MASLRERRPVIILGIVLFIVLLGAQHFVQNERAGKDRANDRADHAELEASGLQATVDELTARVQELIATVATANERLTNAGAEPVPTPSAPAEAPPTAPPAPTPTTGPCLLGVLCLR